MHARIIVNPDNISNEAISESLNDMWNCSDEAVRLSRSDIIQFFSDLGLQICGSKSTDEITIYIICKDIKAVEKLVALNISGVLKTKLEELIHILLASSTHVEITVTVNECELRECREKYLNTGNSFKILLVGDLVRQ